MNHRQEKFVRFQDWNSEKSSDGNFPYNDRARWRKVGMISNELHKVLECGSRRIKCILQALNSCLSLGSEKKMLDPQGPFLQKWNKIFVLSCVIAVSLDPLFFYIPVIDNDNKCLHLDRKMEITASVLRSITDIFYLLHIVLQFRTGFIAPSSRVFGRGVLVEDAWEIAKRYLSSYFLIDILAVLPLPQVVILVVIPKLRGARSLNTKNLLKFVVFFQYIPRLLRVYPLYKEVTRTSGILTETAWAGAAFNLFLYMLASHVLGAFWYLFSIERESTCWQRACGNSSACHHASLYCDDDHTGFKTLLNSSCPIETPNATLFDFGIFLDALQSGVVESMDFPQKFFYCFWWGLQNLSSLGQNLQTSTYVWEICFAVFISIAGLVLFSFLIGNMQTYLQSTTIRLEEMRVKRRDAEQWMSHRLLPEHLRERIRRYEQYKWQETRGVDEENLIHNLPKDLRRDIKRHLCLALLMRVPMFEKMDEQLLDALCDRLRPVLYTENSFIVREGDPVDEMLFIMRGKLLTVTTNGGRTGFFNSDYLKAGDFCGEELLTWALDPHLSNNLPISTRTVQALSEVEAFALVADDLKFVASQFRRLHSKQLRHTFRFYSQQWRTWAACFIQAAWRRHCRKKLEESLREEESRLQDALARGSGSSPSLGATIYASRFAANALRALRRNTSKKARMVDRISPILLQKPAEPDFTALCVYVFSMSALYLKLLVDDYGTIWKAIKVSPASVALMAYCFVSLWFVGGLTGFHLYLICRNQTTYENFRHRGLRGDNRINVYDRGCTNNFLEVFCSRIEPSKNNFRGYVHEEALKSSKVGNIQVTEVDTSDGDRRVKVEEDLEIGDDLMKISQRRNSQDIGDIRGRGSDRSPISRSELDFGFGLESQFSSRSESRHSGW